MTTTLDWRAVGLLLTALGVFGNLALTIALWRRKPGHRPDAASIPAPARVTIAPAISNGSPHRYTLAAFDVNGTQLAPLYEGDDDTAMALAWRKAKQATTPGDFVFLDARCRTHRGRITRR